ncbi:hypothetical protein [Fredinandcohnia quinoae]|uniref:Uncharacterized protein n=1 Tax=Fredinandcohnia quinoae TaxID=2918902 RepID=A0AAW5E5X3_9BACI|nr:hypothetical protein [Fredinandcohnia sp. SECRCQ15]MCH1626254.1 hypothetical protein [Fredinandcohnia sp. SECRCQ15]
MRSNQSNEIIILKQKIIHYQSEIKKYTALIKKYEQNGFKDLELEKLTLLKQVEELKNQVSELQKENIILKEITVNNKVTSSSKGGKKQQIESWFVNNLANQSNSNQNNRIKKDADLVNSVRNLSSTPFSFSQNDNMME